MLEGKKINTLHYLSVVALSKELQEVILMDTNQNFRKVSLSEIQNMMNLQETVACIKMFNNDMIRSMLTEIGIEVVEEKHFSDWNTYSYLAPVPLDS